MTYFEFGSTVLQCHSCGKTARSSTDDGNVDRFMSHSLNDA
jgi:hypothetical protein